MNDEVRQIREEIFDYIILGGVILGLAAGVDILLFGSPTSPWFIRAIALLLVMGLTWLVRFTSKYGVATYLLMIQLVGLVAETFLHTNTVAGFAPYFLVPIMLMASFFFTPLGTLVIAGFSLATLLF